MAPDLLTDVERGHVQGMAGSELVTFSVIEAELPQAFAGLHAVLCQVSGLRLRYPAGLACAGRQLHGPIAVGRLRLDAGDAVRLHDHDGHRDGLAHVGEHPRHARLSPYQSDWHLIRSAISSA